MFKGFKKMRTKSQEEQTSGYKSINERITNRVLETNEKKDMDYQNLWCTVKDALRGKFIIFQTFIRNEDSAHIYNLITQIEIGK